MYACILLWGYYWIIEVIWPRNVKRGSKARIILLCSYLDGKKSIQVSKEKTLYMYYNEISGQ